MLSKIARKIRHKIKRKELLYEVRKCKKADEMSEKLAKLFIGMVDKIGNSTKYCEYHFLEDMKAHAVMQLTKSWMKFDPDRFDNAWVYYRTVIICAFSYYLNSERKNRDVKFALEVDSSDGSKTTEIEVDDEQHF